MELRRSLLLVLCLCLAASACKGDRDSGSDTGKGKNATETNVYRGDCGDAAQDCDGGNGPVEEEVSCTQDSDCAAPKYVVGRGFAGRPLPASEASEPTLGSRFPTIGFSNFSA